MHMASSSPAYLLPGPASSIGSKSSLIKQNLPASSGPLPAAFHSVHHLSHPQLAQPFHRTSMSTHLNQHMSRAPPSNDASHSLIASHPANANALLTTNNGDDGGGGGSGSSGHSLSQSMESINNIGLADDEVGKRQQRVRSRSKHPIGFLSGHSKTISITWPR